jgi:hypothetical protein
VEDMGGAKNWGKEYEHSDEIYWVHEGKFDFGLFADKENGKWKLTLSTPTWPEKYDKKIIETDTKKRMKSFAYDWRRSHTETKDLLKEAEVWIDNTRKIFNPFNVSLALMNLFLFLALLQTWKFIEPVFGEVFLGMIMGAGGAIFLMEAFYTGDVFNIKAPLLSAEEAVSLITGVFAILSSYGYISGSDFFITHFSGVQGGIFGFMFTYLTIHWLKNRLLRFTYLATYWVKQRLFKLASLRKKFV